MSTIFGGTQSVLLQNSIRFLENISPTESTSDLIVLVVLVLTKQLVLKKRRKEKKNKFREKPQLIVLFTNENKEIIYVLAMMWQMAQQSDSISCPIAIIDHMRLWNMTMMLKRSYSAGIKITSKSNVIFDFNLMAIQNMGPALENAFWTSI